MKKMNLLAMSLVSAAALSFSSCSSNDDLTSGGGTQSQADGVYMTLSIAGSNQSTRTEGTKTDQGISGESTITEGTLYLYSNKSGKCVFRKVITSTMFDESTPNKTKPIKISVNTVDTKDKDTYTVYFMANKTGIEDPLATDTTFAMSDQGGADYGQKGKIVMFNQNDNGRHKDHSTVEFTAENNVSTNPAQAGTVYLDRVVARIDEPTVAATKITEAEAKTENVTATIAGITYEKYAISNVNMNSYIVQKWIDDYKTLNVKWGDTETTKYFQPTSFFGDAKAPANLDKFGKVKYNYVFENTTTDASEATALYFQIKANLTPEAAANADFADGTFYRYDKKLYTRIADIFSDAEKGLVSNPFTESGTTTAAAVVASIKTAEGKLIPEGEALNNFRNNNKIEVFRAGSMYYYYPIQDNTYKTATTFSVLRNSIYQLNVTKISEVGKDIPNGPTPDDNNPNYYMTVQVQVNPWILNTKDIELK